MVAHRHRDATVPECLTRNTNCLSQETASPTSDTEIEEIAMETHWNDKEVCRVCVSDHRGDDSGLAERREKWSRSAKIGSTNFLASHANPTRSH